MDSPFGSFFMGGFECSTHRLRSGRRLDVTDSSAHERCADADYARLREHGLLTARDGLRWHLIESRPGAYDFASARAQVFAARRNRVGVIWDLMHYGYPDFYDPFAPDFAERFADYALAAAHWLAQHTEGELWLCPVNEISFFAWSGGEVGEFAPFAQGRGHELKRALAAAATRAARRIRAGLPQARLLYAEPLIQVRPDPQRPHEAVDARGFHASQFEALDMLTGRAAPELGGGPELVDVLGVNYYPVNQWLHHSEHPRRTVLRPGDPGHLPLRALLAEAHARYGLPLLVSETGTEGDSRAAWLRHVAFETLAARAAGLPVLGLCLYPVLGHPGWEDDRPCPNGLWDTVPGAWGERRLHEPLAGALAEAQRWEKDGTLPPQAPPPPGEPARRRELLARLARAAPDIAAEVPARHADGDFPAASVAALRREGLLRAAWPPAVGGLGMGGLRLLEVLRALGRQSLPLGRVFEGHVNAQALIARYGTPEQLAAAAASDALLGVWNTEDGAGLRLEGVPGGYRLRGGKTFATGAGHIRPLLPAELPGAGRVMVLLPGLVAPERLDSDFWRPLGMAATVSVRADLDGLTVTEADLIGRPGDYYAQPEFSGGALRFLAVQLGGADALLAAVHAALAAIGRAEDDIQRFRLAGPAAALDAAWWALRRAAGLPAHDPDLLGAVARCRVATEDACMAALDAAERAVGARGLLAPAAAERAVRDLRMYLRQPAPDAARLAVGAWALSERGWED